MREIRSFTSDEIEARLRVVRPLFACVVAVFWALVLVPR